MMRVDPAILAEEKQRLNRRVCREEQFGDAGEEPWKARVKLIDKAGPRSAIPDGAPT